MKIIQRKPGVILLPVSVVFIIFTVLLILLIGQKRTNNALILEYRASRIINLLLDLHASDQQIDPSGIDENILGFGIYDDMREPLLLYGSAPEILPSTGNRYSDVILTSNRSITIIREGQEAAGMPPAVTDMMRRMQQNMQRRPRDSRGEWNGGPPGAMAAKYRNGVFLEYSNSSYIAERRLIILIIILFTVFFTGAAVLIYRLYKSNRRLLVKTEHDKQLIQLGEAARTLAHEIRNPLGALKIQRDLLARKLPVDYTGNLEVIDRELGRLNMLVERVGEFLRNPLGQPERIDLYAFAERLYGSRVEIDVEGDTGAGIVFDRERLRTVMDNLINNALESAGSALLVVRAGKQCSLEIRDDGGGFQVENLQRLFDPFFTTKNNGTGLGLSVVKRLVEAAGGTITASNRKEGGASVMIIFGDYR